MSPIESLLLRGRDHAEYGVIEVGAIGGGRVAAAISAGGDAHSPSLSFKNRADVPNEDAALIVHDGKRSLLAVADAHFGAESSHVLLARLRHNVATIPTRSDDLVDAVLGCGNDQAPTEAESATTLLVAVVDHAAHEAFGLSFGDSQLFVAGSTETTWPLVENRVYVTPFAARTLRPELATRFHRRLGPGALLAAFTDGVHECHYREPATSLQPHHLRRCADDNDAEPRKFVRAVTQAALEGVDGHPGGQDNIAVVAVSI